MTAAARDQRPASRVDATIRIGRMRTTVMVVASDDLDRVVCAVQSMFPSGPDSRRAAVAWCRRKGVTHYTITQ